MKDIPKVPKRFIEDLTVKNMKVGEIGYFAPMLALRLDMERKLWISADVTLHMERIEAHVWEKEAGEDPLGPLFGSDLKAQVKIEKTPDGYKLYLYEHFERMRDKRFNCKNFEKCQGNTNTECSCSMTIRHNLLKPHTLPGGNNEFIAITEFDEPGKELNDPRFLEKLTPGLLATLSAHELQILMTNSLDDQNYPAAALIKEEIDSRQK